MSERFSRFGGVDFSGAREPLANLWSAVGRETSGKLEIVSLRPHAYRLDLAAFVCGGWRATLAGSDDEPILWGVDFSCGLPAAASRHLLGDGATWPAVLAWVADRPPDEVKDSLPEELRTPRLTDTSGALPPFDVRTYRQTVEGLRWLHELREEHSVAVAPQTTDARAACQLIEVSPSATTIDLGLPRRRAPSRPGEYRARAAALRTFMTFANPEVEALAVTLEDAWDASLACLTTWLVRDDLQQPFRATSHPRGSIELEGWIYRTPAAMGG
jgi:hypothetical protein